MRYVRQALLGAALVLGVAAPLGAQQTDTAELNRLRS